MSECPWDAMRALTGAPNIDWCEVEVCGWAVEPANTYSNLAYFAVGAWLLVRQARVRPAVAFVRWLPLAILGLGAASMVYHAALNYLLQLGDFLGMFVVLGLLIASNARRLRWVTDGGGWRLFAGLVVGLMLCIPPLRALGFKYQLLIPVGVVVLLATEVVLWRRHRGEYRWLVLGVALFLLAMAFSLSDASRLWCIPDSHVWQGHAIWHVVSSLALGCGYLHYAAVAPPPAAA